jgi:hypothetical protein
MQNIIIASPAAGDLATVTGAATSGTMTVGNLKLQQPRDRVRFQSLTGMHTVWEFPTAVPIRFFGHLYGNASSAATVRRRASSTLANLTAAPSVDVTYNYWTDPGIDSESWTRRHSLVFASAAQTYKFWRFDYTDAANPSGYLEIGRAVLCDPWQSSQPVDYGFSPESVEEVVRVRSQGGPVYSYERSRDGSVAFTISNLPRAEALANYTKLSRLRGTSREVLVWIDPDELRFAMEYSFYGLLGNIQQRPVAFNNHTLSFTLQELP